MKTWPILVAGIITVVTFIAYAALLIAVSWPIEDWSINKASLFGDSFGALNSLFTGSAFLLILWSIALQQTELRLQRQEMSRMVTAYRRELHMDMVNYGFNDEELAKVWGDEFQNFDEYKKDGYVNIILTTWSTDLKEGLSNKPTVRRLLNDHMRKSVYFRSFWKRHGEKWQAHAEDDPIHREFVQLCVAAYQSAMTDLKKAPAPKA